VSILYLPLFASYILGVHLTELKPKTCCMFGSERDLKMRVQNLGCPSPCKPWAYQFCRYFCRIRKFVVNLTAIFSERNTIPTTRKRRWKLQTVPYSVAKFHDLWSTNAVKFYLHFTHPGDCYSALLLDASELNQTLPNGRG